MMYHCCASVDWSPRSAFCSVCGWPPLCRNFSEGSGTHPWWLALSLSDVGLLGACRSQKFYLYDDKGEEHRQGRKLRLTWNKAVCQWPEKTKSTSLIKFCQTWNYCSLDLFKRQIKIENLQCLLFSPFSASHLKNNMPVCFSI